jgi:hypothetical protein
MRERLRSQLSYANVMVTVLAFIVLGGTTYAATGGNFILGQSNSAGSTTSLSSGTTGPALKVTSTNTGTGASALGLNVASGHAPFSVNSGTKVTNLNADKLDALNSTDFIRSSRVRRIQWQVQANSPVTDVLDEILSYGPLHLRGRCRAPDGPSQPGFVSLSLTSDAAASANWFFVEEGSASGNGLALLPGSTGVLGSKESGRLEGTLIYDWAGGTLSVSLHAFHIYPGAPGASNCEILGTMVHAT